MLIQRLISTAFSVAAGAAVCNFFAAQVGSWGPWLVGSALVISLIWVIISTVGLLIARKEARTVAPGSAFAVTRDGVDRQPVADLARGGCRAGLQPRPLSTIRAACGSGS